MFDKALTATAVGAAMLLLGAGNLVAEPQFVGLDMAPTKVGTISDMANMADFCGTKPIKVALSDGWGGNGWRKIVRAEFEDEAAKCPNITEVRYTDGQGNPQKQIADIQGLIAQKFDVIVTYPDGGEAILKAMNQATQAGIAVVPYAVGESFPGTPGEDYLVVTTESVVGVGTTLADWTVKNLNGKGNVIVLGGTPGNPTSAAMAEGWKAVFAQNPGITVLEGPVDTNWDPAEAQRVMAGMLAKYPQIDAVMSDYGQGSMGALRAFVAAGRQIPLWPSQDANELGCFWKANKDANPNFKLAAVTARTWMVRVALRKAVAAAQGLSNTEPSIIQLPLAEDSASGDPALEPKCSDKLPPDAILSSMLPEDKLVELLAK
ncbi:substrate-binding domain-containing protein [Tabrizicola sp. BL-A-41-H6]|uniref:substrate-binding domain-containing protein n=1 Tax=Tabrizicola sp. BL-A-41-H6 TaxID=3421107 RepID=UPI003D671DEB